MTNTHYLGKVGTKHMTLTVAPVKYATYNGDVTHMIGEVVGPGTNGKVWTATNAAYDPETNKTRVEFDQWKPEMPS
jgi:hemoglobin-like flavoprotein